MSNEVNAYTLGNPEVYDRVMAERSIQKAAGGAVFWTLEEARAALVEGRNGLYLPESWFPNAGPVPGAVYGLRVDPDQVDPETDEVGAMRLRSPAPIVAKIEGTG